MADKIGNVTQRRYDQLVDKGQALTRKITGHQFAIGDMALEIEPMHSRGREDGVYASLRTFASEIGEEFQTVIGWRSIAAAWPEERRSADATFAVHAVMAYHPDRFNLIRKPPRDRRGRRQWTVDTAAEAVGRTSRGAASPPVSHEEKVTRIRELATDDAVASTTASELMRRPDVAQRVMADPSMRRHLYQAQRDHDEQVGDAARERTPAIKHVEHSIHFLELLSVTHDFVAGIKRLMQQIQADPLTASERDTACHFMDQAQAAVAFCRAVLNTGDLTMDEQLAKLLEEEGPP